jgi:hypothetical protein
VPRLLADQPPSRLLGLAAVLCLVVAVVLLASGMTAFGSVLLGLAMLDAVFAFGAWRRENDERS